MSDSSEKKYDIHFKRFKFEYLCTIVKELRKYKRILLIYILKKPGDQNIFQDLRNTLEKLKKLKSRKTSLANWETRAPSLQLFIQFSTDGFISSKRPISFFQIVYQRGTSHHCSLFRGFKSATSFSIWFPQPFILHPSHGKVRNHAIQEIDLTPF